MKDLWPSASRFWHLIKFCQKRSATQFLTLSDPKIRGQEPKTLSRRAHNPPDEKRWADKSRQPPTPPEPGGWGGDWYVWHAPDGLRARAATALGCMQAGAQKLGVMEPKVYVYTLTFGSLCAHRSVNPRGNASAYTPAKPETVATPDPAVRRTGGRRPFRRCSRRRECSRECRRRQNGFLS